MNPRLVVAISALVAAACGRPASHSDAQPLPSTQSTAVPAPTAVDEAAAPAQHVELSIASVGNAMAFDKKQLAVPAGAEVHLTFTNRSTMTTMQHNWALVKPGTEASVAAAGLKMGDQAGYVDVRDHDMLAHTPQAKAGEVTEVTFTAPEAGSYPYICTFPGHYMVMKGTLVVTP